MLVTLGTKRVNKNRIKEKTGRLLCLQILRLLRVVLYGE